MINGFLENITNFLNFLDIFFIIILIYNILQCFFKGFSLSLISFMKWVLSAVITIILVTPIVSWYFLKDWDDIIINFNSLFSSKHKKIVGCPHSSMRFWDLRYFFDKRDYNQNRKHPMPLPNQVAVNGKMALNMYKNSSFPEKKID